MKLLLLSTNINFVDNYSRACTLHCLLLLPDIEAKAEGGPAAPTRTSGRVRGSVAWHVVMSYECVAILSAGLQAVIG